MLDRAVTVDRACHGAVPGGAMAAQDPLGPGRVSLLSLPAGDAAPGGGGGGRASAPQPARSRLAMAPRGRERARLAAAGARPRPCRGARPAGGNRQRGSAQPVAAARDAGLCPQLSRRLDAASVDRRAHRDPECPAEVALDQPDRRRHRHAGPRAVRKIRTRARTGGVVRRMGPRGARGTARAPPADCPPRQGARIRPCRDPRRRLGSPLARRGCRRPAVCSTSP